MTEKFKYSYINILYFFLIFFLKKMKKILKKPKVFIDIKKKMS